jgi:transcription initiation factor TFIIB
MVTQRIREESSERDSRRVDDQSRSRCPECAGRVVRDEPSGETVCADCALVVSEDEIDRGPEWRAYDSSERAAKSRVGPPTTQLLHDRGLATNIGWRNTDVNGKSLSTRKRRTLTRLRRWNKRYRTQDSKERNLTHALGEIDRMASALGIPDSVRETAGVIYRRALDEGLLPGRSIEGVATAALYAATRVGGVARTVDEVTAVSRVGDLRVMRAYRYLVRELALQIPPTEPMEYVGRVASNLGCRDETERRARELLDTATAKGVHSGKHPAGIAASALYAAGLLCDEQLTQSAVSEAADISEVTIRSRYREVLEAAGEAESP